MALEELLEYQNEDKKLLEIEKQISAAEEYKKYAQARKFMKGAQEKLDALDKRAGELKSLVGELSSHCDDVTAEIAEYADMDEMIEGGGDVSYYAKTVRSLSDRLRALKAELNKLVGEIKAVDEEYKKFRQQTISMQNQLKEYKEKYETLRAGYANDVNAIKSKLEEISKNIPADVMDKYALKRKERIFPILVPLKNGMCVCGMDFSIAQQSMLSGGNLIECEHCRRFVYKK